MTAMLNVKDLRAYYGQVQALHGMEFALDEGSMVTLLGANGAGKTTTLRAICNMVRSTGTIEFEGKPLTGKTTENVVRLGIAHVPQGRGTFTTLTVEENLSSVRSAAATPRTSPTISSGCTTTSRCSSSAIPSRPARYPAVNSRCSRSPAR